MKNYILAPIVPIYDSDADTEPETDIDSDCDTFEPMQRGYSTEEELYNLV